MINLERYLIMKPVDQREMFLSALQQEISQHNMIISEHGQKKRFQISMVNYHQKTVKEFLDHMLKESNRFDDAIATSRQRDNFNSSAKIDL